MTTISVTITTPDIDRLVAAVVRAMVTRVGYRIGADGGEEG